MDAIQADAFPSLARWAAVTGWLVAAVWVGRDWRHAGKRWLAILFAISGLHYLSLALGMPRSWWWLPTMELAPAALAACGTSLVPVGRWRWPVVGAALIGGFLGPAVWTFTVAILVSWLYATARPLGRAVFRAGAPMLAFLFLELVPGFREWAVGPVYRLCAWAIIITQLYLPAWAILRVGSRGEGHWLQC